MANDLSEGFNGACGSAKPPPGALVEAVRNYASAEEIKALIRSGVDVNEQDKDGMTALMHALYMGLDTLHLLIEEGASVNYKNKYGLTALMLAIDKRDFNFISTLVDAGANVNESFGGRTVLMWAVLHAGPDAVALLVERGASVDILDQNGKTALTLAEEINNSEKAMILQEATLKLRAQTIKQHHQAARVAQDALKARLKKAGAAHG